MRGENPFFMSARRVVFSLLEVSFLASAARRRMGGYWGMIQHGDLGGEMLSASRQAGGGAGGLRLFILLRVIKEKKVISVFYVLCDRCYC